MAHLDIEYTCVSCQGFLKIDVRESKRKKRLMLRCTECGLGGQFECRVCGYPTTEDTSHFDVCDICQPRPEDENMLDEYVLMSVKGPDDYKN